MKRYLEYFGFVILAIFSFFYTAKTSMVIKNMDDIMIKIKEEKDNNSISPIDSYIDGDTIVPGISGREVNINASYDAMKKVGIYSSSLLVYNKIKPNISIFNNYNKYIIKGNSKKNQVSLIFKVDNDSINQVVNILDKYNAKANFFSKYELNDSILNLVSKGHNVGSISNKEWLSTLVMKVANQKYGYCYLEDKDKEILDMCSMNKYFVIMPSIITKNTPTLTIKKNLESGLIISMDLNKEVINELEFIIRYIKSKGLDIVNLETLLEE